MAGSEETHLEMELQMLTPVTSRGRRKHTRLQNATSPRTSSCSTGSFELQ